MGFSKTRPTACSSSGATSDPFGSYLEVLDVSSGDRSIIYSDDHVFEALNWTRDGKALIYNRDGRLYRFDLATGAPTGVSLRLQIGMQGPTGRRFRATLGPKSARLVTLPAPTPIDTGEVAHNNNDHGLSFDGSMLAISSRSEPEGGSVVYTVPVEGGRPRRVTPAAPSCLHGWSPDGQSVVYTADRNGQFNIYRIAIDRGEPRVIACLYGGQER